MTRSGFVRGALLALLAWTCAAEGAVSLTSPDTFVVSDCATASLVLRFKSATAPAALRTDKVVDASNAPVDWTIAWDKPVESDKTIQEYQATGTPRNKCPPVGTYAVSTKLHFAQAAEPIELKVIRVADPVLDAPATVTARLEKYPFESAGAGKAVSIQVRETSNAAALSTVSASPGQLKTATGEVTNVRVEASVEPKRTEKGSTANVNLTFPELPDAGAYTTRVLVGAPELRQAVPMDVTLKVRIYAWFLLVIVAIGILLGHFVNVRLNRQALLNAALLAGLQSAGNLVRRANAQKDPAVQQALLKLAGTLEAELYQAATPEDMQKAVSATEIEATRIEAAAATGKTALDEAVARLRGVLEPGNLPVDEAIAARLTALMNELGRIRASALGGDVTEAARVAAELEARLPRELQQALHPWLADVFDALNSIGTWRANEEPELSRASMKGEVQTAHGSTPDPAQLVRLSDALARKLHSWTLFTAPQAIANELRSAAAILRAAKLVPLADTVAAAAEDVAHLPRAGLPPIATLGAIEGVRTRLVDLLRRAANGDAGVDARLGVGDFAGAATLIPTLPAPAPAVGGVVALQPLSSPQSTPLGAAVELAFTPRILVSTGLLVGTPAKIQLDWRGAPPPGIAVAWSCNPPDAATFAQSSVTGTDITPKRAGFLTMSAAFDHQSVSAAAYVGGVTQTIDYSRILKEGKRVHCRIAFVAAVLTAFTAYQIFNASWLGTFGDFFTVFVWGFFGQFGLDRIRTLVQPILSKPLP